MKSQKGLLEDLLKKNSKNYRDLIERVSDDLLEEVDREVDVIKNKQKNPESLTSKATPLQYDKYQDKPKTDNTIQKP